MGESLDQRQVSQSSNCNHTLTYIECCSVFSLIENISNSLDILQVIEDELRERIERLETRQATDDASLLILNRYWNQVNMFRPHVKVSQMLKNCNVMSFPFLQFDENVKLIIRRYDQANSEPEKSLLSEGRSLKPETPEPDGDSNQERAKDRGKDSDTLNWQMLLLD